MRLDRLPHRQLVIELRRARTALFAWWL